MSDGAPAGGCRGSSVCIVHRHLGLAVQQKIGWDKTYENILRQSPTAEGADPALPADQQAQSEEIAANITKYIFCATPVLALLIAVIAAAVLLATVNFGFGGTAKFGQMMAVWMYATLPWSIQGILGIVTVYVRGRSGFIQPAKFRRNQHRILSAAGYVRRPSWLWEPPIDIFTIWALVLLTIGCTIIGNVKKGKAATAMWGWWVLMIVA